MPEMKNFTTLLSLAILLMQSFILYYTLQSNFGVTEAQMYNLYRSATDALYKNECAHAHYKKVHDSSERGHDIKYHEIYDYLNALEVLSRLYLTWKLDEGNFEALYYSNILTADKFLNNVKDGPHKPKHSKLSETALKLRSGNGKTRIPWLLVSMVAMGCVIALLTIVFCALCIQSFIAKKQRLEVSPPKDCGEAADEKTQE